MMTDEATDQVVEKPTDTTTEQAVEQTTETTIEQPANYFGTVPDTWRTDLVAHSGLDGDDAKAFSNVLDRVSDFKSFATNYRDMQTKIRSGELSTGLPENPSEEQLAEWREANGVPADPNGYDLGDVSLDDDAKEIFGEVFGQAQNLNVNNDQMKGIVEAYRAAENKIIERQQAQDNIDKQQGDKLLKATWGSDYQANINLIDGHLNHLPEAVRDGFRGARMADGRGILNTPEVMNWMADLIRKADPAGTVVPGDPNPHKTIDQELAQLKSRMGTDEWFKDESAQARYRELLQAKQRLSA